MPQDQPPLNERSAAKAQGDVPSAEPFSGDCPLPVHLQTRNAMIFGSMISLVYLAAPVVYIGLTQAALLQRLQASDKLANLPSTFYQAMTPLPVLFAWYFCYVRQLRRVLSSAYFVVAGMGALVTVALLLEAPRPVLIAAIMVHAGVLGCMMYVASVFQWEAVGRGIALKKRGQALALAFGVGPLLAFFSSLVSQLILDGEVKVPWFAWADGFSLHPLRMERLEYPWNFACLFGATVPIMAVCGCLAALFVIPVPDSEPQRKPLLEGVFGGFGDFLSDRVTRLAVVSAILVYSGYYVANNMSLFTKEVLGAAAEQYVGYQNALRFGFKVVAGLFLGWLLSRTNPRAGQLATTALLIAGVAWAMWVPGAWFMVGLGLMGAGELFGVYFPNYILCCSPKTHMRRNMAFLSLVTWPAALAPFAFGAISDAFGYKASFCVSLAILGFAFAFVLLALPKTPRPPEVGSDLAPAEN
jgi:hypothetical protein